MTTVCWNTKYNKSFSIEDFPTINKASDFPALGGKTAITLQLPNITFETKTVNPKINLSEKYRAIKPCNLVLKKDGKFSKCYKNNCTYAHTQEELKLIPCNFGNKCLKFSCNFHHPFETVEEYYKRTGKTLPELPFEKEVEKAKEIVIELEEDEEDEEEN